MPKKKILVAEDHSMIRDFIRDLLDARGHDVVTATNGREAIDLLPADVNLVVTDWHMPEKSGEDVLRHVKSAMPAVPVVIISATWDEATRDRIAALLPDAMIEKPLEAKAFLRTIDRLLGN